MIDIAQLASTAFMALSAVSGILGGGLVIVINRGDMKVQKPKKRITKKRLAASKKKKKAS